MDAELLRERQGHVTRLALNRPQKANALSSALVEALIDAVEYAYTDGTRLLVIEGNGPHFCAGFDFTGFAEASEGDLVLRFVRIETLLQALHHAPFVTLALAHGRNFGAGADIVCACSRRIAAADATFRMPGLRFGLVLGTRRLAVRVGADAARELLGASETFDAARAQRLGFVERVVERAEWPALVTALAREAEALPPASLRRLNEQTLPDTRAQDMAALVASASVPGLKERIRQFRDAG
jgi:enoyl-CoA hydratase/carnithine racemase